MTLGEVFLSAFLQVLFDRLASRELLEVATHWKIDAELKTLTQMVSKINAVLKDAEEKQIKDMAVKMWLEELRDVAGDAEDALDEFATEILRCRLEAERQPRTISMADMFSPLNPLGAVFFNMNVASSIKNITERLGVIAKQTVVLGLREDVAERSTGVWQRRLPTTSLVDDRVYGREEDAKKIVSFLVNDVDDGVCVIPLVGLGGVGKTTLAQIVYNNQQVDEHFDKKSWVYVSGEFDLVKVTKEILESLGDSKCVTTTNLELLQSNLRKNIMKKKFLLVLDDLWNENYVQWDALQLPFRAAACGSKIIVTTRSENVVQIVSTGPVFHVDELSEDDSWSLFEQHAFTKLNSTARASLESIGKQIAKKCKGLPLAAKAMGGLLHSKLDIHEWQHILTSEVWELPHQKCGILPGLSLSYHHLPSHLKPCFAYCAIFPKNYEFDEKELVRLWIAEGLVLQPQKDMQIEDAGSQYFHDLLSRSLFQRSNGNTSRYIMHDLINDLAQFVAGERCLRLEKDVNQYKNLKKARHLSYIQQKRDACIKFEAITQHKCLRTLLPLDGGFGICRITNKATHHLLKNLTRLRVLSLSHYEITKLPDLIGELKHLRYLDLSNTSIKLLPESVATLYNLQTLILHGCRDLIQLPKNMGNLVNLRHLDIRGSSLQQLPPHMGRLKNLRTLPYFIVSRDSGSGITELKNLSNLQADLYILGLEYVDKDGDAVEANLQDKKYLYKLVLEWGKDIDGMIDEDVLDALQPHRNIKELSIKHYSGAKFPIWMADPSFSNLVFLSLSNCRNCRSLPSLGQLPSLKNLIIEGMDAVCSVGREFYGTDWCFFTPFQSLETLKFKNMLVWEEWVSYGIGEFPCLHELCIEDCPELIKEIPSSLTSLKTLEIRDCKKLSWIPCLPQIHDLVLKGCNLAILESVGDLTSLEKLHLYEVLNLKLLPSELIHRLTSLCDLQVVNCDELTILSDQSGLPHSTSLQRLEIRRCSFIFLWSEEEQRLPQLLECLEICYCSNLIKLPQGLHSLKSLKTLKIVNCPGLVALPEMDLPSNLRNLKIKECRALQSLPEGLMRNENLSLEFLEIDGCASLHSLPGELPLTLQQLKISNCPSLNVLPPRLLHKNTNLESLQIFGCSFTSLPLNFSSLLPFSLSVSSSSSSFTPVSSSNSSPRLKEFEVRDCNEINHLPDVLHNFLHLDKLVVSNCPKLVSFPDGGLPPNLRSLWISDCENLKALPNRMYNISSLQDLTICNCTSLQSYPDGGLPNNLKSFSIIGCKNLNPPSKWDLYKLRTIWFPLLILYLLSPLIETTNTRVNFYEIPRRRGASGTDTSGSWSPSKKRSSKPRTTIESLDHDILCIIFSSLGLFDLLRRLQVPECDYKQMQVSLQVLYFKSEYVSNTSGSSWQSMAMLLEKLAMKHRRLALEEGRIDIDEWVDQC